jgi:hypothetical protein
VRTHDGLLLIVDQFERLYVDCNEDERNPFIDFLLEVASPAVKVLISYRGDAVPLGQHPELQQRVKTGKAYMFLSPMEPEELRQAIEAPAHLRQRTLERELLTHLVDDIIFLRKSKKSAGTLPLLQFALNEIWARDEGTGILKLQTYEQLGYTDDYKKEHFPGLLGAVGLTAGKLWRRLPPDDHKRLRPVLIKLVSTDENGEAVGRRVLLDRNDQALMKSLKPFVSQHRLLVLDKDIISGQPTVEVAHEALITAWTLLVRLAEEYKPFRQWHERDFTPHYRLWKRDEQTPLQKQELQKSKQWQQQEPELLSVEEHAFIEFSHTKWREDRNKTYFIIAGVIVAGIFVFYVLFLQIEAFMGR